MPAPGSENRSLFAAIALCLALVGAASMIYYHVGLFMPRVMAARATKGLGNGYSFGDDFYPVWLTTRLWQREHRDLYSMEMTREIQTGLFGRALDAHRPLDPPVDYRSFAYPAFTDLLLWPAAEMDFPDLRLILVVLLPILTASSVWLWMRALDWSVRPLWFVVLVVLMLCNYPLLEGFFALQPGLIVGFLLAASALALRRGRLMLAGCLMSLTLMKPQMTLPAIFYLLLWSSAEKGRTRLWFGFLITCVPLAGASLWIWPHWIAEWTGILIGYKGYATPSLVNLLPGTALGAYAGPAAILVLLGVGVWLAWHNRGASAESPRFWWTLSFLLAITSVTILPGQAIYDHVILYPGILLLVRYWRELRGAGMVPRTLAAVGAVVVFWPWVAAFAVIAARPWLQPARFESTAVFALPIRTAASLPFAVLALLAYARRINTMQS
jgi:Glycosyltransferase family 87